MDRILANKFKKGDQSAFEKLYEIHFDKACSLALGILKSEFAAKDVVQMSFLRAYEYRSSYNDNKPFSCWFNRILINECKRYFSKGKDKNIISEDSGEYAQQNVSDSYNFERYELLYKALQELSDDMRIPLLLKYVNGFKEMEIAEILGLKNSTVKSRLYEGRKSIRNIMLSNGYKEYSYE